jgi:hypothetical protein
LWEFLQLWSLVWHILLDTLLVQTSYLLTLAFSISVVKAKEFEAGESRWLFACATPGGSEWDALKTFITCIVECQSSHMTD